MTYADLISQVIQNLSPGADEETYNTLSFAVMRAIDDGLSELAHETASGNSPLRRALFVKDFSVSITVGEGSLTTAKTDSEPCIAEYVNKGAWIFDSDTLRMQHVPDKDTLDKDLRGPWRYYTIEGDAVYVKNYDSSTTTGTATAKLPYIPLLSAVTAEAAPRLVEIVTAKVRSTPEAA